MPPHPNYRLCPVKARAFLAENPEGVVIEDADKPKYILRSTDLPRYLENELENEDKALWLQGHIIDLLEIPAGFRWRLFPVHNRATLQEALLVLRQETGQAVYVPRDNPVPSNEVAGIVTRDAIDNYYQ